MKGLCLLALASAIAATGVATAASPTCGRPIVASRIESAGNCFYDLAVATGAAGGVGGFAVGTGTLHPVTTSLGARQNVAMGGGDYMNPFSNSFSIRSWTTQTDYFFDADPFVLMDDAGYQCFLGRFLAPPVVEDIIRPDGQAVGVRVTLHAAERGDDLDVMLEAIAHGTSFEDSAVELSATVTNEGVNPTAIGWRFLLNSTLTSDEVAIGVVPPDPPDEPWMTQEQEWIAPSADHFLESVTATPSVTPYYYFGGVSLVGPALLDPPPSLPDRIAFSDDVFSSVPADRAGPANTCFDWHTPVPPRSPLHGTNGPEALAYYWHDTPATARVLAPGESATVRIWLWAFIENPVTCVAAGPAGPVECTGSETLVSLDATGSHTVEGNPLQYRWSSGDPLVTFDDPTSPTPTVVLPGLGVHDIHLDVGIGPYSRSCSLPVAVVDTTPPVFDLPPSLVLRSSDFPSCHASVVRRASATDACSADVVITHVTSPDIGSGGAEAAHDFPVGLTRIFYTAVDASGNVATGETSVTLVDDVAPTLALTASPTQLWPPNHRMHDVHVDAEAADDCDAAPAIALLGVDSSEPFQWIGDGSTEADVDGVEPGGPDFDFRVRAERSGLLGGRSYTAIYALTDASGNSTSSTVVIGVAHDRRRRP